MKVVKLKLVAYRPSGWRVTFHTTPNRACQSEIASQARIADVHVVRVLLRGLQERPLVLADRLQDPVARICLLA